MVIDDDLYDFFRSKVTFEYSYRSDPDNFDHYYWFIRASLYEIVLPWERTAFESDPLKSDKLKEVQDYACLELVRSLVQGVRDSRSL